ncbi:hypothetical protein K438DRAFT_1749491 [Mycena galopus ATCC 62051]|nr:hypothetical protein K438DRAFT_1749491 [Mycena galopus ATCC 62051]
MSDEADPSNAPPSDNAPAQTSAERRLEKVGSQLEVLLAALRSSQAAAAAGATVTPTPPVAPPPQQGGNPSPLVVTPPVVASQFTPPIAPLNSPTGASPSLCSQHLQQGRLILPWIIQGSSINPSLDYPRA